MSEHLTQIRLAELLRLARSKNASDLHITPALTPVLRIDGVIQRFGSVISAQQCEKIAENLFSEHCRTKLRDCGDASVAYRDAELGPFRVHAYLTGAGISFAIRLLAADIPTLGACRP